METVLGILTSRTPRQWAGWVLTMLGIAGLSFLMSFEAIPDPAPQASALKWVFPAWVFVSFVCRFTEVFEYRVPTLHFLATILWMSAFGMLSASSSNEVSEVSYELGWRAEIVALWALTWMSADLLQMYQRKIS